MAVMCVRVYQWVPVTPAGIPPWSLTQSKCEMMGNRSKKEVAPRRNEPGENQKKNAHSKSFSFYCWFSFRKGEERRETGEREERERRQEDK